MTPAHATHSSITFPDSTLAQLTDSPCNKGQERKELMHGTTQRHLLTRLKAIIPDGHGGSNTRPSVIRVTHCYRLAKEAEVGLLPPLGALGASTWFSSTARLSRWQEHGCSVLHIRALAILALPQLGSQDVPASLIKGGPV